MTPQEAIKNIDDILDSPYLCDESIDYQLTTDDIECLEMAKEALEKQIPEKPGNMRRIGSSFDMSTGMGLSYFEGLCEACKTSNTNWRAKEKITYCEKCGQALDWSDTE